MANAQVNVKQLIKQPFRNEAGQEDTRHLAVLTPERSARLLDTHLLVEGLNTELGTKLTVISPRTADTVLTEDTNCLQSFPKFPTDAVVGYERVGRKLGSEIVFHSREGPRVVMPTGLYKGERDIVVAVAGLTSADIKSDGKVIYLDLPKHRFIRIEQFPTNVDPVVVYSVTRTYLTNPDTKIPHGIPATHAEDDPMRFDYYRCRSLSRLFDSSYVGLVVRGARADGWLVACFFPNHTFESLKMSIVAEVPPEDVAKIEAFAQTHAAGI